MHNKTQISLIIPKDQNPENPVLFLGILCLASYLKNKGLNVKLYDEQLGEATENIKEIIENSLLVGLSVMTSQLKNAKKISEIIHKNNIPVVWGGYHPLLFPKQCLKEDYVDFVIYDEGEETLLELYNALRNNNPNLSKIKGLWFSKNNQLIKNEPRPYIDVNETSLNWDLININRYKQELHFGGKKYQAFPLHAGRGCPYECTFCIQTILNQRKHRSLTAENIVKEIKKILTITNAEVIDLEDDNFFLNLNRVKEFCRLYKKEGFTFKWVGTVRVNYILRMDEEFLKELKECGCVLMRMGLESGSQRVLDELIKKGIKVNDIMKAIEKVKPYDISLECSFMTGIPGETIKEQTKTFNLIKKILKSYNKVHIIGPQLYRPYPGAKMYEDAKRDGFEEPKTIDEWIRFLDNFGFLDINLLKWIKNKKSLIRKTKYFKWSQIDPKGFARPLGLFFRGLFRLRMKIDFYELSWDLWAYEKMRNIYMKNIN